MLSLSGNELVKVSKEETFYSQILDLNIDGKAEKAVVRDIQRDPASGRFQHLDFLRIVADQAITVSVPLHFLNEESCVGVKMEGGTFTRNLVEVKLVVSRRICLNRSKSIWRSAHGVIGTPERSSSARRCFYSSVKLRGGSGYSCGQRCYAQGRF